MRHDVAGRRLDRRTQYTTLAILVVVLLLGFVSDSPPMSFLRAALIAVGLILLILGIRRGSP